MNCRNCGGKLYARKHNDGARIMIDVVCEQGHIAKSSGWHYGHWTPNGAHFYQ